MFKVDQNRTFTRTVTVMTPSADDFIKETLKVTFNYLPTERTKTFDLKTSDGSTEFLKAAISSMGDLTGEDESPLAYSAAVRDIVISLPNARLAITQSYFDAIGKVAEGN